MKLLVSDAIKRLPIEELADAVRASYRDGVKQAIAQGQAKPLVLPYCLLAPFVVPALWLAVPHTRRPWLYRLRWAVVAVVAASTADVLWLASSANTAFGYSAGMLAFWGMISTMHLLVWTRPQFEAARIVKTVKEGVEGRAEETTEQREGAEVRQDEVLQENDGLRQRKPQGKTMTLSTKESGSPTKQEYEYVWQPFPADAPLKERLNWAFDLTTNFRLTGWNCAISVLPRPKFDPAEALIPGTLVDMSSMPLVSKAGYRRSQTEAEFVRSRVATLAVMFLTLDFLAVVMMKDPFFVLGPDQMTLSDGSVVPPPRHLENLPPRLLLIYRQVLTLAGVLSAVSGALNVNDLAQYRWAGRLIAVRGELWPHASTFGPLNQVFERGLAGWWGASWHQTFRAQFVAPATWLTGTGRLRKGSFAAVMAGLVISFLHSGLLHLSGSLTCPPKTKPWRSPTFFALQLLGLVLQHGWTLLAAPYLVRVPRPIGRLANLLFTVAWLHFTADFFVNDLASAGIWLLEPVPISVFRALGFGHPGDSWWRWNYHYFPGWYSSDHWWQSGVTM